MCATSAVAEIGTVVWQQKFNPVGSNWNNGFFYSAGFNNNGSILASGFRDEADSGSAIGVRFDAKTGAIIDSPAEWFLFEYTWGDYAHDRFLDQHIDSNGNIYFVGMSYAAGWNNASVRYNVPNIWKYDSNYNNPAAANPDRPLWRKYHVSTGTPVDNAGQFNGMAVDSSDNIYAVGYYTDMVSAASERDWIIDKYDTDGTRVAGFPLTHDHEGLHDYAYDVATDSEDNFVVVGSVLVNADTDHHDWAVRKYEGDGTLLWETQYDFAGSHDQALFVAVDTDDNIIVSGYRRHTAPSSDNDWYIVKYAKDGDGNGGATILWDQSWDDGSSTHGASYGIALLSNNNIYAIGNQLKDSSDPAYTDRYRPILQYRDGQTGDLLDMQDIVLDPTDNDLPAVEHDFLRRLVLSGEKLLIAGYTQQDGGYSVVKGRTGRMLMLDLFPMFKDGFE
ncbi:MAG: hypothetical protein QNK19_01290 [Xanthomonadales bacterium]|nr:hypothetical protein [Xanthomonadales bacterium]